MGGDFEVGLSFQGVRFGMILAKFSQRDTVEEGRE